MERLAILSVYDKSGLAAFAGGLAELGWRLVASGGTAAALRRAGLAVTDVADLTGAPEMLAGRVKTLHPAVHAGILARDTAEDAADLATAGFAPVDLVVCNLYPFAETVSRPDATLAEAVEQIDIGGVTLLRAAAKNFQRVTVVSDPADYEMVLAQLRRDGAVAPATRESLAAKAFAHTRDYDTAIAAYLSPKDEALQATSLPATLTLHLARSQPLRYGENPHQKAALYTLAPGDGPLGGRLLQGKALSYNNLLDLDAAWRAAESFAEPTLVIVKHLSPCGIASAEPLAEAFRLALASDPVSAFGGVLAANRPVDLELAEAIGQAELFVEAIMAPVFSEAAREWFARHKANCRLVSADATMPPGLELRAVRGGLLAQEPDMGDPPGTAWEAVSRRHPSKAEWADLRFGWLAVQQVKSNAIIFARGQATVGIGGGLPSRIDAVRLAAAKAGPRAEGAVMASDAFFPFPDGIEVAAAAGVTAVIEPGGSVRDDQVIAAADRLGLALVFTGTRHFRH